ncbi:probable major facilitator protein MIRC (siderophore transporter) [Rhynchosporium agropyri]|uniref:Probable major facilitator protein MIRC (Siderophore transporter) n=1 Tax=Rhynchosporium agropyri TaxID=914238 RepID=A0A1E1KZ44_9HELO|nr:probable major facilitator protein MIRC (siderophore transporter) [Rhynchosporium agropyri]
MTTNTTQVRHENGVQLDSLKNRRPEAPASTERSDRSNSISANGESDTKDVERVDAKSIPSSGASNSDGSAQNGVKNIEAVSMTWTKWGLILAYSSIFLMAFSTSLEGQVVQSVAVFATSSFKSHSLISTVFVVQGVVNAVIKTPMAKIADVFGRLEAFSFSILLYVLGYIQMSVSSNVETFAAAQIFYSAGNTGLQILQQVFIADTSDLLNRALWSSLPDIPFLITVWIGSLIGKDILKTSTWRWGYGIWCIVLPVMFMPLALTLWMNNRKAKKLGLTTESQFKGTKAMQVIKHLWSELDIGGILLLTAAFALVLISLTIASKQASGWASGKIIAMLVIGLVCFIIFPFWESIKKLAPHPLIPMYLLKSRTFSAGCAAGFFYFMAFYLSVQPYFYSYLVIVHGESIPSASRITQTFSFTATVTSVIVSFFIKYSKYYKPYLVLGTCIYIMGIGLMIKYRTIDASRGALIGSQIAVGVGGGMINVPAQLGVQASTDHQHVAVATAVFLTCVELGGAVGSAISGAVWSKNIPSKLRLYLPEAAKGNAKAIYDSITEASSFPMGSPEREAINRAYQETMHTLLIIAICVTVPILLCTLLMQNCKLDEIKQGVKGRVIGGEVKDGREIGFVGEEQGGGKMGLRGGCSSRG